MRCCGIGALEDEWARNTQEFGAPIWRQGYWFWQDAGILSYLVCLPFGDRYPACKAWASEDMLPAAKVPPWMQDMSVLSTLTQAEINRAREWIVNPQLRNAGKPTLPTAGPLDGKLYWGALLVLSNRVVMPYDQAKIVAQIVNWSATNGIAPMDPESAELIQIPGLEDLKNSLKTTTTTDAPGPQPFWQNPVILAAGVGLLLVVMITKRNRPKR